MSKVISVRVDDEVYSALEFQAAGDQETVNDLVKSYIRDGLKNNNYMIIKWIFDIWNEKRMESLGLEPSEGVKSLMAEVEVRRALALSKYPDYPEEEQAGYIGKNWLDKRGDRKGLENMPIIHTRPPVNV